MKKIFFSLFIVMVLLISFSKKSEAQVFCEPGYVAGFTVVIIGDCTFAVNFCYKCGSTSNPWGGTQFYIRDYAPLGPCNFSPSPKQISDAFKMQQMKNFCTYEPCCENQPCYDGLKIEILVPLCVRKYNQNGVIKIQECPGNTSYCRERVSACIDVNGNLTYTSITGYNIIVGGDPQCSNEIPLDPMEGQYSSCYSRETNCTEQP